MRIAVKDDIRVALTTLGRSKWRSGLTMLGVIIAVMSVVLVVGIGEGARQQVADQLLHLGKNTLLVRPATITSDSNVFTNARTTNLLQNKDVKTLNELSDVSRVVPVAHLAARATIGGKKVTAPVWASSSGVGEIFNKKLQYGSYFADTETSGAVGVLIGKHAAEKYFGQEAPLGQSLSVLGRDFVVYGVFEEVPGLPWVEGIDFNNSVIVPFWVASAATDGALQPSEIYVTATKPTAETIKDMTTALEKNRGGQQDFEVLTPSQVTAKTDDTLSVVTLAIFGIAIISLIVGGVGIMNVMFVSVTERMHEIGLRKALGATNQQILRQFVTEAFVVSSVGGLLGALLAIISCLLLSTYTNLNPIVNYQVVLLALLVTVVVGVVFGTIPAAKAARKDPIEALRHE